MNTPAPLSASLDLPLVLDLDGTLSRLDTLFEGMRLLVIHRPQTMIGLAARLASSDKAALKDFMAQATDGLDYCLLFNDAILALAQLEKKRGRRIVVATATHQELAERVLRDQGYVDEVIGSRDGINLKSREKARRLCEQFPEGFVYAGNDNADLAVWQQASDAIAVNTAQSTLRRLKDIREPLEVFGTRVSRVHAAARAMRPHQWAKNLLVFVPQILAGQLLNPAAWQASMLSFLALCLVGSGTYIFNDLADVEADRSHWSKYRRPIAHGDLPIWLAFLLAPGLIAAGFALAATLGGSALMLLAAYLAISVSYSVWLKRIPMLDIFCLGVLFTLRLLYGAAAVSGFVSEWLFSFSMLFFLSLAGSKRVVELQRTLEMGEKGAPSRRGYRLGDLPLVRGVTIGAGIGAQIVLMIYIIDDATSRPQFLSPEFLWSLPAIIFLWQSRIWLLSTRGEMHDDPVMFSVRDKISLVALAAMMGAILAALYLELPV